MKTDKILEKLTTFAKFVWKYTKIACVWIYNQLCSLVTYIATYIKSKT